MIQSFSRNFKLDFATYQYKSKLLKLFFTLLSFYNWLYRICIKSIWTCGLGLKLVLSLVFLYFNLKKEIIFSNNFGHGFYSENIFWKKIIKKNCKKNFLTKVCYCKENISKKIEIPSLLIGFFLSISLDRLPCYSVSHSKVWNVILLWWGYTFRFFWV